MTNGKELLKDEMVAHAILALATEIKFLGFGGADRMEKGEGAIEELTKHLSNSNKEIAAAIQDVSTSMSDIASSIQALADAISELKK